MTFPRLSCRGRDVFGDYYLQKHNGRKLTWHSTMESCTLKAHFDSGAKELQVSVHQACVLLLFNAADKLGFEDIHSQTAIPLPDLRRTLQSLALGKVCFQCAARHFWLCRLSSMLCYCFSTLESSSICSFTNCGCRLANVPEVPCRQP